VVSRIQEKIIGRARQVCRGIDIGGLLSRGIEARGWNLVARESIANETGACRIGARGGRVEDGSAEDTVELI